MEAGKLGGPWRVDMSDLTSPLQLDWSRLSRPTNAPVFFQQHLEWLESERAIANGTFDEWRERKKAAEKANPDESFCERKEPEKAT